MSCYLTLMMLLLLFTAFLAWKRFQRSQLKKKYGYQLLHKLNEEKNVEEIIMKEQSKWGLNLRDSVDDYVLHMNKK